MHGTNSECSFATSNFIFYEAVIALLPKVAHKAKRKKHDMKAKSLIRTNAEANMTRETQSLTSTPTFYI